MVRALAVEEDKLIKYGEMLPGHAIRVSAVAIEVVCGKPGSMREGIEGPTPGEVDSRRLAGSAPSFLMIQSHHDLRSKYGGHKWQHGQEYGLRA